MNEIRYCKKCGCELMSTNKKKLCENCRRNKNGTIGKISGAVGSALAGLAGVVVLFRKAKKK
ncbi:MAG: hypothetical protein J5956_04260 [Ruminococcus sp.]|jgi:hypothetical protein|nr:hypothetical protein [Ruminococcus sp.]